MDIKTRFARNEEDTTTLKTISRYFELRSSLLLRPMPFETHHITRQPSQYCIYSHLRWAMRELQWCLVRFKTLISPTIYFGAQIGLKMVLGCSGHLGKKRGKFCQKSARNDGRVGGPPRVQNGHFGIVLTIFGS